MKKLILLLATALVLTSCSAVKFEEPQPASAASIPEFPAKMLGTYISEENDTLYIEKKHFKYLVKEEGHGDEGSVEGELAPHSSVLKKVRNTYILNLKDEQGWDVFPFKIFRNKMILYYEAMDTESEQLILNLQKTSNVQEIKTEDGKFDHYLINPSAKEFRKLLKKNLFSEKIVFRKVKGKSVGFSQ